MVGMKIFAKKYTYEQTYICVPTFYNLFGFYYGKMSKRLGTNIKFLVLVLNTPTETKNKRNTSIYWVEKNAPKIHVYLKP